MGAVGVKQQSLNVLLVTLLAMHVSYRRMTERVPNSDGGKLVMKKAIRAHGNAVEHVTVFGIATLALSLASAPETLQAILVLGFTLTRLLHAGSMLVSAFGIRRLAAGLTYLFEIAAILMVLVYAVLG